MSVTKRKRTPKKSMGIHGGGGKVRLSHIEKILLGGGALRTIRKVDEQRKGIKG